MVRSLASRPGGHTRMSRAHADAKATEAAVPEATEAATAAARARRTREAAMRHPRTAGGGNDPRTQRDLSGRIILECAIIGVPPEGSGARLLKILYRRTQS